MIKKTLSLISLACLALTGCVNTVPPTAVHQPMTIRPEPRDSLATFNGSIYNTASARPLFEDRRARFVGDIITINIAEKVQASKQSENIANRTSSMDAGIPTLDGVPFKGVSNLSISANNTTKFDGKGSNTSTADFTSTITVTVIEVLPNGNLLVSGEKQIGLKEGEEFVRFSGVVNPNTITTANTVQSTQVADARIEYKANGFINDVQVMGWLSKFFLSFLPF